MNRFLIVLPTLCFAFLVLIYSLYSASALEYKFDLPIVAQGQPTPLPAQLPSPPKLLPDNPFWFAKAMQDRTHILITLNPLEKAEVLASISNQRLVAAKVLFENGNAEDGMATLAKAEKYLQAAAAEEKRARQGGAITTGFLQKLLHTAYMHQQAIDSILHYCPEDACPLIVQTANTPKLLFEEIKITLTSAGNEILSINKI